MLDSLIPSLSQIANLKKDIRREDRRVEAALSGKKTPQILLAEIKL